MNEQNQSRNKKWCKYCDQYYSNSYFEAHLETKMHKENILSNQIHEEPNQQQTPQKDFIMNSNHLIKYNIVEEGHFKNAIAIVGMLSLHPAQSTRD